MINKITNDIVDIRIKERKCKFVRDSDVYTKLYAKTIRSFIWVRCSENINHRWEILVNQIGKWGCPHCRKINNKNMNRTTNDIVDIRIKERKCKFVRDSDVYMKERSNKFMAFIWARCSENINHRWEIAYKDIGYTGCPHCRKITNEMVDTKIKDHKCKFVRDSDVYYKKINGILSEPFIWAKCSENINHRWEIRVHDIRRNRCPKCNIISKGEEIITDYLNNKEYEYKREFKFKDCVGNKYPLRFDFYISKYNVVIEYHGKQHYKQCSFGSKKEGSAWKSFLKTIKHDNIKKNYCLDKGINFIEIPYYEFDNIEKILDEKLGELKLKLMSNKAI